MKITAREHVNRSDWIKSILGSKGLTLHQVSEESVRIYGHSSPWCIQHNFYRAVRSGRFGPSLHQLCALSRISGYRLFDWLTLFGFGLEDVPRLQVLLPSKRTILLDASLGNPNSTIPWFRDVQAIWPRTGIVPLGQLLEFSHPRTLTLSAANGGNSLYAKIGSQDALAFPEVLPGSIVRVDPQVSEELRSAREGKTSHRLFLIEHSGGLWCTRLHFLARDRICPISNHLPFAHVEMQMPFQARILGVVNMEIRRITNVEEPDVPKELTGQWKPQTLRRRSTGLGELLRSARKRAALSLRQASAISRQIAQAFGDERYFVAPGSLSDYEASNAPPRHIHKVITLCILYTVHFADFLNAAEIKLEDLGQDSIPGNLLPNSNGEGSTEWIDPSEALRLSPNLMSLMAQFGEVPFFLRGSFEALSGVKKPSLRDFFWIESGSKALHPYLRDGLLLLVDRHKRQPIRLRSMPLWRQPLYLLMTREGRYICACCSLDNGVLIVHPSSEDFQPSERFRNRHEAEVVGQVVAIVRKIA